ncbi:hypothetical protein ACFXK0_02995 [Nocardia sp. NPDC059177]|uniref:hypothetical protein n=1 Tax=Nocardia sp. NPDC059177 TaxID=3346759 RepID=UPI003687A8EF
MTLTNSTDRKSSLLRRAGVVTLAAAAAAAGFAGPATALPTDPEVQFTPTISRTPGANCAAIINAWTVPQPQSGQFGVKVEITQTGDSCQLYRIAVRWRNLDTGYSDGQSHAVENGELRHAPDGVITGMGMGPGAGRVEAWIVTTDDSLPQHQELEHISGRATFTLG